METKFKVIYKGNDSTIKIVKTLKEAKMLVRKCENQDRDFQEFSEGMYKIVTIN